MSNKSALILALVIGAAAGASAVFGLSFHLIATLGAAALLFLFLRNPLLGLNALLILYPFIERKIRVDVGAGIPALSMTRVLAVVLVIQLVFLMRMEIKKLHQRIVLFRPETFLVLFAGMMLISAIRSPDPFNNSQELLDSFLIPSLLFFVVSHMIYEESKIRNLILTLTILALTNSVITILQYITGSSLGVGIVYVWQVQRVSGIFPSAAIMGSVMAAIVPFMLYEALRSTKLKLFWWGSIGLSMIAILLSFFRTCWMALLVEMIVLSVVVPGRLKRRFRIATISFLIVAAIVGTTFQVVSKRARSESSVWDRVAFFQTGIKLGLTNPLLGAGYRKFGADYAKHLSTIGIPAQEVRYIKRRAYITKLRITAHNSYIQVFADTGLIAFVFFMLMLGLFLHRLILMRRRAKEVSDRYKDKMWFTILILEFIAYVVALMFQSMLYYSYFTNILFLITMGVAAAQFRRSELSGGPALDPIRKE
jgi:O-antigen ligase